MENDEIIENVAAAIDGVVEIVPKKWTNVRSFHLKMSESLALPIYQSVPDLGLKIEGLKKVEESKEMELVEEGEEEEEKEKKTPAKKKGSNKGRIHEVRYMDDDLGEALDNLSDEEENENAELGDKLVGKKRKKVGSSKKDKVLDEEKKSNKSSKVKKVAIVKQDDGDVENEVVDDVSLSGESKKKKKTSKTEKSESGELKMKDKKTESEVWYETSESGFWGPESKDVLNALCRKEWHHYPSSFFHS
ncbi:hypothetical protein C5167_036773 [Papaver somniferum]|uniref:Uncharacterized protein n=1 Tax=Papaver somniferum TaxID=3469 RepID=A0A4Y7I7Z8_PAPSO|nr:hypothetical protein C5167_036773 [Papaver somniferum]